MASKDQENTQSDPGAAIPPHRDANTELLEQLQRLQAEFDNYRKRSDTAIALAQEKGREAAIRDLFPIIDAMELAKSHAQGPNATADLASGFALIHSQFTHLLEQWSVTTVPAEGIVDPRLHEVYTTETLQDKPAGTILQVLQPGYVRNGTVLRTAKVKAARN